MGNSRLKILLVNHSDTRGGASVVTHRLMDALCAAGVDARMLVAYKSGTSLRVAEAAGRRRTRVPFLAEHVDIYMRNGLNRDTLFRISTGRYGLPLHRHPWFREADIVVLNWVNQGMASLREVELMSCLKPVIWTMHDMWNMTGVCHYTAGCTHWQTSECRECPLVGRGNMAHSVYKVKERVYASANLRFVAVSNALSDLCRQSPLMRNADISVIPNAFPVDKFVTEPSLSRRELGLPPGRLVLMGAARLDDPVKNLLLAIESLNMMQTSDLTAVFYGGLRDDSFLKTLRVPYVWLGHVENAVLPSIAAHCDVVISTSLWETLPGTLIEGISAGAIGVSTANGGQRDIISEGETGFVVDSFDPGHFASAIHKALGLRQTLEARAVRHHDIARRFSASAVARAYLRLVRETLEPVRQ